MYVLLAVLSLLVKGNINYVNELCFNCFHNESARCFTLKKYILSHFLMYTDNVPSPALGGIKRR